MKHPFSDGSAIGMLTAGCLALLWPQQGYPVDAPAPDQIRRSVSSSIPPYWQVKDVNITASVNVGDVLVLETMILVRNHLGFSGGIGHYEDSWTEFHSTLSSTLTTTTPGATLDVYQTVIPIPAAIWLFGSGLIGLIGVARRKQK